MASLRCPNCGGGNTQRLAMVHASGKYSSSSFTVGGVGSGKHHHGFGAATFGEVQSDLSKMATPPDKRILFWIIPIAFIAYGVGRLIEPNIGKYVALGLCLLWAYNNYEWNKNTYPYILEEWNRKFICHQCGDIFLVGYNPPSNNNFNKISNYNNNTINQDNHISDDGNYGLIFSILGLSIFLYFSFDIIKNVLSYISILFIGIYEKSSSTLNTSYVGNVIEYISNNKLTSLYFVLFLILITVIFEIIANFVLSLVDGRTGFDRFNLEYMSENYPKLDKIFIFVGGILGGVFFVHFFM